MKKLSFFSLILVFGVTGISASQQYDDLLKLIKSGVSEDVIVAYINASHSSYDLSSDEIVHLKENGASKNVIVAVIQHKGSAVTNSNNPAAPTVRHARITDTILQPKSRGASDKVMTAATKRQDDTVTVNVPNAHGGYTPVKLVKIDKGYLGPRGEFYQGHPTVAQLKVRYGK